MPWKCPWIILPAKQIPISTAKRSNACRISKSSMTRINPMSSSSSTLSCAIEKLKKPMRPKTVIGLALVFISANALGQTKTDSSSDNPYHLRYYRLPGMPDSAEFIPIHINDSTTIFRRKERPPVRPTKPGPFLKGSSPGLYKEWMKIYYQELKQYREDSIQYFQRQHRIDSLHHIIDSLQHLINISSPQLLTSK